MGVACKGEMIASPMVNSDRDTFLPLTNSTLRHEGNHWFRSIYVCVVLVNVVILALLASVLVHTYMYFLRHFSSADQLNDFVPLSFALNPRVATQNMTILQNASVFDRRDRGRHHTNQTDRSNSSTAASIMPLVEQVPLECVCRRAIHNVSWVENIIVWDQPAQRLCNFHHFSPVETKELLAKESILVMGDSVSRELAINMAGILLDTDFVTSIVDQDAPHNHIDTNPLEFIGHPPSTDYQLKFFWGESFPLILLKVQTIPHNVTTAIISFGAWFKGAGLNPNNAELRHDLLSLVWTLCSSPGSTSFVIRLPTLGIYDDDNQNIDFVRSLMLKLMFPNNTSTLCCGNHSIVMHDTYTIMEKRSRGELRLPATDHGIFHFAPIMRVNLMQSVFNILPFLTKGGRDPCCMPVTDQFKAPVRKSTLGGQFRLIWFDFNLLN
eukprot:c13142_g1_i6.p1 GENE.c13142_g1_i6~~c13142_g1_i6.p1  ORF type:complete len:438 (+),score=82.53 c13142_g1_i6:1-1314(+)